MEAVKVGVIGCGFMAQMAHIPCLKAVPGAEVVALCDFREEVVKELCRRHDIASCPGRSGYTTSVDELLKMDIDAVYILTPVQWHLANISAALNAGKHVFTEKPAAMCRDSIDQLEKLAIEKGKTVCVGYMKRHEVNIEELAALQNKNEWGKLLYVRTHSFIGSHWNGAIDEIMPVASSNQLPEFDATNLDPGPKWLESARDSKFYSFDNPYYGLLDTGCHSINLLRKVTGITPEVTGVRNLNGVQLIDFKFGEIAGNMEFCVNFNMHRWDEVTELYYEKASVRIKTPAPLEIQASAVVEIYSEAGALHKNLQLENNRQWAFKRQTAAFVEQVKSGKSVSMLSDAINDVSVIEEIYKLQKGL